MTAPMESFCIPYREIPHTSKLFATFVEDFSRVSSFYAHPPTAAGVEAAAHAVNYDPGVRQHVVEILREQNQRFTPQGKLDPATARNLERLSGGAVAIVTGQQVGLFSGPAYTIYKALSAIRCAEQTTRRGIDAVPVFWLASEDHDLAEINHTFWNTRNGLARYELPAEESGRRVGEILLGEAIEPLVSDAAQTLEGPFAEWVAVALRDTYTRGETYGSAFGKLMARLLAGRGMIFLDQLDPRLHRLSIPHFDNGSQRAELWRDSLLARTKELEAAGYHSQIRVTHETTLLFWSRSGRREPVRAKNGNFVVGDSEITPRQLLDAISHQPEQFSPSALLRPVIQDSLLPTAAYIGGPAEVAYMAQAQIVYQACGVKMPAVLPRASFTIVDQPIARFLAHYSLDIRDLFAGPQHLRAKMEQKSLPAGLSTQFEETEASLRATLKAYEEPLGRLDSTLIEALRASERKMLHQIEQLKGKVARAENFRSGVLDRKERILIDSLYPDGGLQERIHGTLPLLASLGPELLDKLTILAATPGGPESGSCASQHQVLGL
jgi:bacillithiol biosynthesis cysteine-adding enzyme BshC